jgi:hypothetical protein
VLTELIHDRLLRKRARLHTALPGLSSDGTDAVLALSCGQRRWRSALQALHQPANFERLTPGKWNLEEVLIGALEVGPGNGPLDAKQRLFARHFSMRVSAALGLEYPVGFDLSARLIGAGSWGALIGPPRPLSPDEPLYTEGCSSASLHVSDVCAEMTGELEALVRFKDRFSRAFGAESFLKRRDDFIAARCVALDARVDMLEPQLALDHLYKLLRQLEFFLRHEPSETDARSPFAMRHGHESLIASRSNLRCHPLSLESP